MSEISHHRSILTLSHVQGLGHSPQDVKAPIPTHRKSLALASNLDDKLLLDMKQKEPNSPFNLGHFPVFQDENVEEINVKTNILAFSPWETLQGSHLSMNTSTFMEWFSSENLTRSLKTSREVHFLITCNSCVTS